MMMVAQPCKYIKALQALSHFMLQKPFKSQDSREGWHSYVRNFKKLYKTWETWDTAKERRHRREQLVTARQQPTRTWLTTLL